MQKQKKIKKKIKKDEITGSETVLEKIKRKTPWIFGKKLRKPKIIFPKFKFRRISLPFPSRLLIVVIVFIFLFILQTGIIYLIIREPPTLGIDAEENPVFIWPESIHEAYIVESIVASILMILCSIGFILLYHGSKYFYNKKFADWIIIIGILLIIISFYLLQFMLREKIPRLTKKIKTGDLIILKTILEMKFKNPKIFFTKLKIQKLTLSVFLKLGWFVNTF